MVNKREIGQKFRQSDGRNRKKLYLCASNEPPMKSAFFFLIVAAFSCLPLSAQTLKGVVMQNDSAPCSFATVYVPSLNRGTAANQEGEYELDDLPAGTLMVEYSCMGQQSLQKEVTLTEGQVLVNNETLQEALLMLPPSIITPNGESPSHYVLRHVWDQADINRKRIQKWDAELKYSVGLNDIDIFLNVIPKKYVFAFKAAATVVGMRKFVTLIFDYPDLKAKVSLNRSYQMGKIKDTNCWVTECNRNLSDSEKETLYKNNRLLIDKNIFDDIYGSDRAWGRKGSLRDSLVLTGSYEMDGKVIDVLEYTRVIKYKDENDSVKTAKRTTSIHVVEDAWGILKIETKGTALNSLRECRDLGGGIYMPISASNSLESKTVKSEEIPTLIKKAEETDKSKWSKDQKRAYSIISDELRKRHQQGRDIHMNVYMSYSIRYNGFEYK